MSGIYRDGMAFGFVLSSSNAGIATWTANAASNRLAMRFVARHSGALSGVALRIGTVTGSPTQQDAKVSIWSVGSDGLPGTQLEERDNGSSSGLSSNSRLVVSGWTTNLTAGQEYFIVVRNGNASPTSNHFAVAYGVEKATLAGNTVSPPAGSYTSTDSGSTWTAQGTQRSNYQIIYNTGSGDFTYDWLVTQTTTAINLNGNPTGVRFTTPSGIRLRVIGVQFADILNISSSSWAIRIKQGGDTIGTTLALSRNTSAYCFVPFADVVVLDPDTQTDVEALLTSGTAGSVRRVDVDTTLSPTAFPFQHIENGSVVSGRFVSMMKLILDPSQPFEVVSGGGGGGQPLLPPMPLVQTFM
jgi:hypothetical protein